MGYSVVNVNEIEPAGPAGAVRFVRRELGVEAFGLNWFEVPAGMEGVKHDESGSGQEEVNVILRGSGDYRNRRRGGAVRRGHGLPLRSRDDAPGRRRARRRDDARDRLPARQLRGAGPVLIARVVIWNLADSKTTLAELREHLPMLPDGSHWISNEAEERFGLLAVGDVPDLAELHALIGVDTVVYEEFDVE